MLILISTLRSWSWPQLNRQDEFLSQNISHTQGEGEIFDHALLLSWLSSLPKSMLQGQPISHYEVTQKYPLAINWMIVHVGMMLWLMKYIQMIAFAGATNEAPCAWPPIGPLSSYMTNALANQEGCRSFRCSLRLDIRKLQYLVDHWWPKGSNLTWLNLEGVL